MEFSITLSGQELDLIGTAIVKLPYDVAAPLLEKLRAQVAEQVKGTEVPAEPEKEDKKVKKLKKA